MSRSIFNIADITDINKRKGEFVMAKCQFCGKAVSFGIKVSHSHRRANKMWKPNIRRVRAVVKGTPVRVYACTRCIRSGKISK